jgi:hypothetical protein
MEVGTPEKHQQKHNTPYLRRFPLKETENSAHFLVNLSCNVHIDGKRILTFPGIKSISFAAYPALFFFPQHQERGNAVRATFRTCKYGELIHGI